MLRNLSKKDLGFDFKLPLISPLCLIGNYKLKGYISLHTTNFWLSLSVIQLQNPFFCSPPVYQGLSMGHDWPVKNAIVDLPIRLKMHSW